MDGAGRSSPMRGIGSIKVGELMQVVTCCGIELQR